MAPNKIFDYQHPKCLPSAIQAPSLYDLMLQDIAAYTTWCLGSGHYSADSDEVLRLYDFLPYVRIP